MVLDEESTVFDVLAFLCSLLDKDAEWYGVTEMDGWWLGYVNCGDARHELRTFRDRCP